MYSFNEEINHQGGYQQLANLYASLGDVPKVKMCVDSLLKLHPSYSTFGTNIFNIANYFITYGQEKYLSALISWYCNNQKIAQSEFYERWLSRTGILISEFTGPKMRGANHNPNLDLSDIPTIQKIFALYYDVIIKENINPDGLHFQLALYYKHRGALLAKIYREKDQVMFPLKMDSLFELAVENYRKVSHSYLGQTTEIAVGEGRRDFVQQKIRRKDLFLYPDHFQKVFSNTRFSTKYSTDGFFNFLLNRNYFSSLYQTANDLNQINTWLSNYYERKSGGYGEILHYAAPFEEHVLLRIDSVLSNHPLANKLNNNLIRLLLINFYLDNKQPGRIEEFYAKLEPDRFIENMKERVITRDDYYYLINRLAGHLASEGNTEDAIRIARVFLNHANRLTTYSMAAWQLLADIGGEKEKAFLLLDSAICEMNRITDFEFGFNQRNGYNDPREALVFALSSVGGQDMHDLAGKYVEQISLARQGDVIRQWIQGAASSGQYYQAYSSIPALTSKTERLYYFNRILMQESLKRPIDQEWRSTMESRIKVYTWEFIGYDGGVF